MKIVAPNRVTRSYTQRLIASPEGVFPLLCPVRQADWIPGWDPRLVVSTSGVAEADCAFVTPAATGEAFWYVTRYAPRGGVVELNLPASGEPSASGCPPRGKPARRIFMPA